MKKEKIVTKTFDIQQSIKRAKDSKQNSYIWSIELQDKKYVWTSKMDRVAIIRKGLPYETFEFIGKRINIPVNQVLSIFGVPQTTYNKKRREKSLLSGRDSEAVLMLTELIDFGIQVFNNEEEKFQRWLKKPNISLGGTSPESLLDSITGIQEVKNCLSRLEYGNLA
jgi:putative toxin-antitoxin system antitoxin component (TIGR02293 family)